MGLDWCLNDKPKPGCEEDFARLKEAEPFDRDAFSAVAVTPAETLGYPTVSASDETKAWYIENIVRPHQERIAALKAKPVAVPAATPFARDDGPYIEHWSHDDEFLLERDKDRRLIDEKFVSYGLSTVQAYGAFANMAGLQSFRGKAVVGCLSVFDREGEYEGVELRNRAYTDMDPPQMAEYAAEIEAAALESFNAETGAGLTPPTARDFVDNAELPNCEHWGECECWTPAQERISTLQTVLDGARWLRFWADLGHSMHAWY